MNRLEIEKILQKELDKERFRHTLGVMYTAATLAMNYNYPVNKAMLAGLLHDCAKCISNEKKIKLCEKYNLEITDIEKKNPYLLHAKLGACLAKKKYGIEDEDILHSIRFHTTGSPEMNVLDKIIYIADYIEPNRDKAPNLDKIRFMAFQDLDKTMLEILEDTLSYLKTKNNEMDPMTAKTYDSFKKLGGN